MRPERFRRLRAVLERRQPDLTVLMDGVHKSHNFSAILRNCDAVGVLDVHVVSPERGVDVHHGTSAGTKKWIRVARHETARIAIEHLRARGFRLVAAHPSATSHDFRDFDYSTPTAVVVGAELHGLSEEAHALADAHVAIPMMGMARSLNVSVATALLLFEAMRQRLEAGMYEASRLDPEALERRLFEWAYPRLARKYRSESRPYPRLDPDGAIVSKG